MLSLLIADADEDFSLALADSLQENYRVSCCRSGKEALKSLLQHKQDILILDLMLPELDGISLLHRILEAEEYPMVLATSPLINDYIIKTADALGVGYLMVKPCEIRAVAERLQDLRRHIHRPVTASESPKAFISQQLLELGVSAKLRGYEFLREAILLQAENPGQAITKELYPSVAAACNTTSAHVERSIRNAIASAWSRRNEQTWLRFFPINSSKPMERPSNGVFISRIAESIVWSRMEET